MPLEMNALPAVPALIAKENPELAKRVRSFNASDMPPGPYAKAKAALDRLLCGATSAEDAPAEQAALLAEAVEIAKFFNRKRDLIRDVRTAARAQMNAAAAERDALIPVVRDRINRLAAAMANPSYEGPLRTEASKIRGRDNFAPWEPRHPKTDAQLAAVDAVAVAMDTASRKWGEILDFEVEAERAATNFCRLYFGFPPSP